ncbi:hypothetical protein LXL04_035275 [Taraxacum kok-saghyz]
MSKFGGLDLIELEEVAYTSGVWNNFAATKKYLNKCGLNIEDIFNFKIISRDSTQFWYDKWIGNNQLKSKYPTFFELETRKKCEVADRFYNDEFVGYWRTCPVNGGLIADISNLNHDMSLVILTDSRDQWRSNLDADEQFTVSSLRKLIDQRTISSPLDTTSPWISDAPIKSTTKENTISESIEFEGSGSVRSRVEHASMKRNAQIISLYHAHLLYRKGTEEILNDNNLAKDDISNYNSTEDISNYMEHPHSDTLDAISKPTWENIVESPIIDYVSPVIPMTKYRLKLKYGCAPEQSFIKLDSEEKFMAMLTMYENEKEVTIYVTTENNTKSNNFGFGRQKCDNRDEPLDEDDSDYLPSEESYYSHLSFDNEIKGSHSGLITSITYHVILGRQFAISFFPREDSEVLPEDERKRRSNGLLRPSCFNNSQPSISFIPKADSEMLTRLKTNTTGAEMGCFSLHASTIHSPRFHSSPKQIRKC